MKYSKPLTYFVCLLATGSAFAAGEAAKPAAPAKPATVAAAPVVSAPILRISAIDGLVNPNHKKEIQRRAGKKIKFSADLFVKENGKLVAQKASPQDFVWRMSTYLRDCDPARPESCKNTGLEVTKEGVTLSLTQKMFDTMTTLAGLDDEKAKLTLKVSYVKDKKITDKIVILDLNDIEAQAEMERATKELEAQTAEENSGLGGFLRNFFGGSSSSSSSDDASASSPSDDYGTPAYEEKMRQLEHSSPSVARDIRELDRNRFEATHPRGNEEHHDWHNRDYRNFPAPSAPYVAPAPAPEAPREHEHGGRGGEGRGPIGGGIPAPSVAPPAPVVDNSAFIRQRQEALQAAQAQQAAQAAAMQAAMAERMKAMRGPNGAGAPPGAGPNIPGIGTKQFGR
ncbi:MAG: hypothetical protein ACXWQO_15080 [Bdellovibrionota bacterium]